jgi:hypothetical protein
MRISTSDLNMRVIGTSMLYSASIGIYGSIGVGSDMVDYFMAKADRKGHLENSFGNAGILRGFVPSYTADFYNKITNADGSVLTQFYGKGAATENGFMRIKANGTFDPDFGNNGLIASLASWYDTVANGGIITLEQANSGSGSNYNEIVLTKYLANGQLDVLFGAAGVKKVQLLNNSIAKRFKTLPDNKLLLLCAQASNGSDYFLTRLNGDGTVDLSFGAQGYVFFNADQVFGISAFTVLPNGRIVLGGYS